MEKSEVESLSAIGSDGLGGGIEGFGGGAIGGRGGGGAIGLGGIIPTGGAGGGAIGCDCLGSISSVSSSC